jgi:hypothetical protein
MDGQSKNELNKFKGDCLMSENKKSTNKQKKNGPKHKTSSSANKQNKFH